MNTGAVVVFSAIVIAGGVGALAGAIRGDDLSTEVCLERTAYLRSEKYRIVLLSGSDDSLAKAVREQYADNCGWKHLFGWLEPPLRPQSGSGLGRKGGS
jgi:hypothetical protein